MKASVVRTLAGFLILFLLYQSAEGIGARLLGSFPVQAGLMLLTVLAAWPVGRYLLGRKGYDAYALQWAPRVPALIAAGLGLAFAAKTLSLLAGLAFHVYTVAPAPAAPAAATGIASALALALALVSTFVPSIAEDILTRGFWWRRDAFPLGGLRFILATSLLYVLNHIYRLGNGPAEWLMLFCFGIAYAAALVRTGSLWAAVGVHWGWNLANALLDRFATVESLSPSAPFLSAAVHLLMAAVILALPRRPSSRQP